MNRKLSFLSVIFSLFVFLGAVLVPIRAEAAYGNIYNNDDNYIIGNFYSNEDNILLTNTYVDKYEFLQDNSIVPHSVDVSYVGTYTALSTIVPVVNHVYGGYFAFELSFSVNLPDFYTLDSFNVSARDTILNDGLSIMFQPTLINNHIIKGYVYLNFNEFFSDGRTINIPLVFDLELSASVDNSLSENVVPSLNCICGNLNKVNNTVVYSDPRDYPGYDGYNANQNQQIIDGILDNTTAVNDAKSGIVAAVNDAASYIGNQIMYYIQLLETSVNTQFSQLFNNMQAWYNGLTNTINSGIDRLINNYSGTGTTDAANKFDDSAGDLEQVESDLTTITNSSIGSYTESAFDTSVITSLGSSLVYVVTWFTNFWNMGGLFTSILNVGLALSVAFFILRLRGGS